MESHRRAINEPAVWRLTLKGRKLMNVTRRPVYLLSNKVPHWLGLADALIWLLLSGKLGEGFTIEPRYKMRYKGKERLYAPDAQFTWNKTPYFLEYQSHRSDLSPKDWSRKWELRHEFYRKELWKPTFKSKPTILVLTRQKSEKVKTGAGDLPIRILRDISQLKGWFEV